MRLIWSSDARRDLTGIVDYIAADNPLASVRILKLIEGTADRLIEYPFMFRRGEVEGTREAIAHPNYVLIYKVTDDAVEISAVLHTRRQYP